MDHMTDDLSDREKISAILDYWLEHNREHLQENDKWRRRSHEMGYKNVAQEFERIGVIMAESIRRIEQLRRSLPKTGVEHPQALSPETHAPGIHAPGIHAAGIHAPGMHAEHEHLHGASAHRHIELHQIGIIRTPYTPDLTREQMQEERRDCRIIVNERYKDGLHMLDRFRYVVVLFYLDRAEGSLSLNASPPAAQGQTVGVFASRSPHRPNPVGLCITELKGVAENVVTTGRIDAFDKTPLIDMKPYFEKSDSIPGAGNGWLDDLGR